MCVEVRRNKSIPFSYWGRRTCRDLVGDNCSLPEVLIVCCKHMGPLPPKRSQFFLLVAIQTLTLQGQGCLGYAQFVGCPPPLPYAQSSVVPNGTTSLYPSGISGSLWPKDLTRSTLRETDLGWKYRGVLSHPESHPLILLHITSTPVHQDPLLKQTEKAG